MKKDNSNEIVNQVMPFAKAIYGDIPNQYIVKRIEDEARTFNDFDINKDKLLKIKEHVDNKINQRNILIPRRSLSNSLIYYFLGLTNINPMPKHTYCPKCHLFNWGNKEKEICPNCGEGLIEDGYDLPFELLKDDIRNIGFQFDYSGDGEEIRWERSNIRIFGHPLLKLANELGINQQTINQFDIKDNEIIKCLNRDYYLNHYQKQRLVNHQAFIGLPSLGSGLLQDYLKYFNVNDFDELTKLICLMYGTRVYHSIKTNFYNEKDLNISNLITSRDDLYKFLRSNKLNEDEASIICRETRLCRNGNISSYSENKLKEAGVEEKYINFMKDIRNIFYKGHVIEHTKLEFIIAKIYLDDPIRYYRAFFSLNKNLLNHINENDDFIRCLIESKNTKMYGIYLGIIDLMEKGYNPRKLIKEIKETLKEVDANGFIKEETKAILKTAEDHS